MTEEEWDEVAELKSLIWREVHKLVNKVTANVPDKIDEAVRQQLTEEFRFWRQDDA